jgi:hypothetical protein
MKPPLQVLEAEASGRGEDGARAGCWGAVTDSAQAVSDAGTTTSAMMARARKDMGGSDDAPPGIGRRLSQMLGTIAPRLNAPAAR